MILKSFLNLDLLEFRTVHSSQASIWSCPLLSEHSVITLKFSYSLSFYFLFLYICFLSQKYYCLISIEKLWYWVLTWSRCFCLFTFFYNWILFHFFSLQTGLFLFPHFRNILEKELHTLNDHDVSMYKWPEC